MEKIINYWVGVEFFNWHANYFNFEGESGNPLFKKTTTVTPK